jgi:hypothetical protein
MSATPISYNVVYDTDNGLRYEFPTGYLPIPLGSSGITALTGIVTAGPGSGSQITTINLASAHLIVGNGSGIGTSVVLSGDATLSNIGALTLSTVNSNVGSFTSANITVDAKGRITAASNGSGGISQLTGDVTAGPGSGSQAATLATVNSNVGSFTSANITVDAKGRITAAANGSGGGGTPGGANTDVQYNNSGAFGGNSSLTYDGSQILSLNNDNGGQIYFNASDGSTFQAAIIGNSGSGMLGLYSSDQVALITSGAQFTFTAVGSIQFPQLSSNPAGPAQGELYYNLPSEAFKYWNGSLWKTLATTDQSSPSVVDSAPTVGGAATESVVVTGLLTTSTIWAVTQRTKGGANLPLLSWTNTTNGHLNVIYSADMGVGAVVRVLFIP